jgi:hypothetical protein
MAFSVLKAMAAKAMAFFINDTPISKTQCIEIG